MGNTGKPHNLIGLRVGRRVITSFVGRNDKGLHCWNYKCDCGKEGVITGASFRFGGAISCGCYDREVTLTKRTKHGLHNSPMYNLWRTIRARCHLKTSKDYDNYGARGIEMFAEWRTNVKSFNDYILSELGPRPSNKHSLDRIDNNKNYEPNNLRWATESVQKRNMRRNRHIEFGGMRMIANDWTNFLGVSGCNWRVKEESNTVATYIRSRINTSKFIPNLKEIL